MKNFTKFMFAVLVALASSVYGYAYDFKVGGICYNIVSSKNLTCAVTYEKYYTRSQYSGDIVVPSAVEYDGNTYTVTEIGNYAFCTDYEGYTSKITSITLPNTVTKIVSYAFYGCKKLTSFEIPGSVASIGGSAFASCSGLTSIEIPSSITKIESSTFSGCSGLTSIVIPNSVTSLGGNAFQDCTGLTSIELPNTISKIEYNTFQGCASLSSIAIPNSVTEIGSHAFWDCTGLTSIELPNSITKIEESTFSGCTSLSSIVIPNSVTEIASDLFSGCTSLASVEIPNSITKIGQQAFYDCTSLTSVEIPASVTSMGNNPFCGCSSLAEITVAGGDSFRSENDCLINNAGTIVTGLNKTTIVIPNSVKSIGNRSFYGCTKLKNLVIGSSVSSIATLAFGECKGISEITSLRNTPPSITSASFESSIYDKCELIVPTEAVAAYMSASVWNKFKSMIARLVDGEEYSGSATIKNTNVEYTRNFETTDWQAFYVPFKLDYSYLSEYAEVACLQDCAGDELRFVLQHGGDIEPNTPCIVKPRSTGEMRIKVYRTTLEAVPETDGNVSCSSATTEYTLCGTYKEKADVVEGGCYVLAGNEFRLAKDEADKVQPYGVYLKVKSLDEGGDVQPAERIGFVVVDNTTGISEVNNGRQSQTAYSLYGVKVGAGYKGIVIKDGKKVIVK